MVVLRVFRNEGVVWIGGSTGLQGRTGVTGLKKTLQDNYVEVWFKGIAGSVQGFGVEWK